MKNDFSVVLYLLVSMLFVILVWWFSCGFVNVLIMLLYVFVFGLVVL